jgi:hypothetical protein
LLQLASPHIDRALLPHSPAAGASLCKAALFPLQRQPLRGTGRQLCGKRSRPNCTATMARVIT